MNNIKHMLMAITLLVLGGCQLADMAQFVYANANAVHYWEGEVQTTSLPFELVDDHIVLPVSVNGSEPLNFVLDSGAAASLVLESHNTRSLPLELGAELPVSGVGSGENPVARIIADTGLTIGSAHVEGLSMIYLAQSEIPFFDNLDEVYFDGVIGAPVFDRFVIEIDYDQQLIHFSEPGSASAIPAHQGWDELPLEIASGVPYLTTQVATSNGALTDVKLLVDTGYRGSLSLTPSTHDGITLPPQTFSTLGHGLSGEVQIEVGKTPELQIGTLALHDLPVSYSITGGESDNNSNGIIGNQVLQRFRIVFDYPNERMLIKPGARYTEPMLVDRSGLLLRPHRLGAVVKSVAPESVTRPYDLQQADIITRFEDRPLQHTNIVELKQLLSSQRESVSLCWQSPGQAQQHCGEVALASRFAETKRFQSR